MRTTINLPDALVEAARAKAAAEGRTFTSVVEEGLRTTLSLPAPRVAPVSLPAFGDPDGRLLVDPADRVVSAEELAGLEDTLELLRDREGTAAVDEGIADIDAGRTHDQDDVLADLRRRRGGA